MTLPLIRGADGLPAIAEPTEADHADLWAALRVYETIIRDLWDAAVTLHRIYDQAAHHGASQEGAMLIRAAEHEYDRCRNIYRMLRTNPKARP